MRIDDRSLLWKALVVLAEGPSRVADGPLGADPAVRLALAVAFAFSKGDREPFDDYWREMRHPMRSPTDTIGRYCRVTKLQTQLRGVLRAVGFEPNFAVEQALDNAVRRSRVTAREAEACHDMKSTDPTPTATGSSSTASPASN